MEGIQKFRYNTMNVSAISTFENIKGGIHNNCKDVYFVRAIGVNASYVNDIKNMDENLINHMNEGRGYYLRMNSLPKMMSVEDTTYYSECYTKWLENEKKEMHVRFTQKNRELSCMLGNACKTVENIYCQQKSQATASMMKNLTVKLLFWCDAVFADEKFIWDEKKSIKIVAANIEKQQEYLFFYLITLMGGDVLLLQSRSDIGAEEEKLGLSAKFVLGDCSQIAIPEYVWHDRQSAPIKIQLPERTRSRTNSVAEERTPATAQRTPARAEQTPVRTEQAPARAERIPARTQNSAEKSFEELAQLASSIVLIAIHDEKGKVMGSGSGIMIGRDGYILTNNHVASGGKYYSVRIEEDDKVYETDEVIKYNYVLDLALIRIDRTLAPIPIYQGKEKLVRGQKVVAIGSPLGLFNSVSDGIISGFRKFDDVDMIQFTAPISHGSSGGAVINMQGEVIGISTSGFDSGQNINLAVSYECINTFIKGFT